MSIIPFQASSKVGVTTVEAKKSGVTGKSGATGPTRAQLAYLRMGRPDEEIIVLGEEIGAGLIVTGSRGTGGMRRALMGSASDSVVRHAHCPVLVVRREKE